MNDDPQLLRLRSLLSSALELVDRISENDLNEDLTRILSATARTTSEQGARTRADVLRFVEAVEGGDEGWLITRSVPGEYRTEAVYLPKLPAGIRKTLDI